MSKCILLVEDNPEDVRLTKRALTKNNITNDLVVVGDGAAALEYLVKISESGGDFPAVTLIDIKLPKMDGLELLKEIRGNPRLKYLPLVMLTSSREQQDVLSSYNLGANSYIRKPVDFEQFIQAVHCLGLYWLLLNETAPTVGGPK